MKTDLAIGHHSRHHSPMRFFLLLMVSVPVLAAENFQSHPPQRPLPVAFNRPLPKGPVFFADAARGDDANDGSKAKPWRSINHGLLQLKPGATLCLRGTFYEHVVVPVSGTTNAPVTIRSAPNELAIIDGGLREFFEAPAKAWVPFAGGAKGEFVSFKKYPQFNNRPIVHAFPAAGWEPFFGKEDERPLVLGHFGDTMVPLHGYRTAGDLRDHSMLWDVANKFDNDASVYCGPGVWFNRATQRIHAQLAHTKLAGLGDRSYSGETDPHKIPLCISGPYGADVLRLNGVKNIIVQDIVLRGASGSPLINLYGSENITLDGLTLYGGAPALLAKASSKIKILNTAFRGNAAPWSSRASMKYRGTPSYQIISQRNKPQSEDWEIANCEFTDDHDGVWLRYVNNLRFHHNLVDRFNDDGIEVGARKRDHELYIFQNLIARCGLTFTLHQMEVDEGATEVNPGSGIFITRNVIDLRRGLFKGPPREPDPTGAFLNGRGTLCGDHGSAVWPDYWFYHNTVIRTDPAWRGYYGHGIGGRGTRGNQRAVLNNIFVQAEGIPGLAFGNAATHYRIDGNLHWGLTDGPKFEGDFFKTKSRTFAFRKQPPPEAWFKHDQFTNPRFKNLTANPLAPFDLTLQKNSPAKNTGVPVPAQWPDPLRTADVGQPDLGALPAGTKPWRVGVRGRLSLFDDAAK